MLRASVIEPEPQQQRRLEQRLEGEGSEGGEGGEGGEGDARRRSEELPTGSPSASGARGYVPGLEKGGASGT